MDEPRAFVAAKANEVLDLCALRLADQRSHHDAGIGCIPDLEMRRCCDGGFNELLAHTVMAQQAGEEGAALTGIDGEHRSEEHTSELQSLMRISYAVFCLKKKKNI